MNNFNIILYHLMYQAVMNLQCTCIERKCGISETVNNFNITLYYANFLVV
jgi:hypothetical protein